MRENTVQQILRQYGLQQSVVLSTEKGYRNESHPVETEDGRKLNLIVYKREPGILQKIREANRIADYVAEQGLPARHTTDERILRLTNGRQSAYASLYSYLPGVTIPWEAYTMDHIKLLGKTMSDMHAILTLLAKPAVSNVADEYLAIIRRMQRYFADMQVREAMRQKLDVDIDDQRFAEFEKIVAACKKLPDQQTLHMDFVRGNILFSEEYPLEVSGILDFEKTAYGSPLFDISRTLAFLLVDCKYKQPDKIKKYFLSSGYNKRGASRLQNYRVDEHQTLLDALTNLFLTYDFYKFLRHNPYESLSANEHYGRTKDLLKDRKILAMA